MMNWILPFAIATITIFWVEFVTNACVCKQSANFWAATAGVMFVIVMLTNLVLWRKMDRETDKFKQESIAGTAIMASVLGTAITLHALYRALPAASAYEGPDLAQLSVDLPQPDSDAIQQLTLPSAPEDVVRLNWMKVPPQTPAA